MISLPKYWLVQNKIKKGDILDIEITKDGKLIVSKEVENVEIFETS